MSKRTASDVCETSNKSARCDDPIPQEERNETDVRDDEYHEKNVTEWTNVQSVYNTAMSLDLGGILLSSADVNKSYERHMEELILHGYRFGTYNTERSLFEVLHLKVFRNALVSEMGKDVFDQVRNILTQINNGSRPKKMSLSCLVMMSTEYITPVANLLTLLTHKDSTVDDLKLLWELTDRLWCFAHPIYEIHSGHLDETCAKITTRMTVVCKQ